MLLPDQPITVPYIAVGTGIAQDGTLLRGLTPTEKRSGRKIQVLYRSSEDICCDLDQMKSVEFGGCRAEGPVARSRLVC